MKLPGWRRSPARTTLLGVAALGALIWAAVSNLGLDPNSVLAQLLIILSLTAALGALAAVGVLALKLAGRLFRALCADNPDPSRCKK